MPAKLGTRKYTMNINEFLFGNFRIHCRDLNTNMTERISALIKMDIETLSDIKDATEYHSYLNQTIIDMHLQKIKRLENALKSAEFALLEIKEENNLKFIDDALRKIEGATNENNR